LADLELTPAYRAGRHPEPPLGLLSIWLAHWAEAAEALLFVARGERRADLLADAVTSLAPPLEVIRFPPWDCLPYDRAQPSRSAMGRRMACLQRLAQPGGSRLVVTTARAIGQRVPPPDRIADARLELRQGERLDREALAEFLGCTGYRLDERVDEPGEAALRGGVVDLFPPDFAYPVRIEIEDERIAALRGYDPLSQRSTTEIDMVTLRPASEILAEAGSTPEPDVHTLPEHYPALATLFDLLPGARAVIDRDVEARFAVLSRQVEEAYEARRVLRRSEAVMGEARRLVEPARLYLDRDEWNAAVAALAPAQLEPATVPGAPGCSLLNLARRALAGGDRVVLAAPAGDRWGRRLAARLGVTAAALGSWREIEGLTPGALALLDAQLPGFVLPGLTVLFGQGSAGGIKQRKAEAEAVLGAGTLLQPGDRVVHAEHGIAELIGIETVATKAVAADHASLRFADDRRLLVPVDELDRVWRYGSGEAGGALDRLDGEAWRSRRDAVAAEIEQAAMELARRVAMRARTAGPALSMPRGYERIADRFPFELSDDQATAIEATLGDLARGAPPMDRLLCGDVGFGKTEVAIRAAAIAALNGRQVAILAPTTLLVAQHLQTFRRRFAGLGVRVEQLSRQGTAKEAREVRAGLADGSIAIVVGTHALSAPELTFADLALVIVDEEQRFGTAQKEALARLRDGVHVLHMTATPIPRTLQSALAGLLELSVLATPPQRRVPVRTFVLPFEPAVVREALLRERLRGGRSFVVVPRIADLAPMRERLAGMAGDLDLTVAYGRMRAADLDRVMLAFADGDHDVLLTTAIVEAGLDIPGADTMIIWRPERFGLAQLHQLRGRVGRGRQRGACYLLHEPDAVPTAAATRRLESLATFESLGAGFAISARDLDLRGAGSLVGDEQAGHVQRIGTGLYRHLLERALQRARGEEIPDEWTPELVLGVTALVPADYVPEPELRLELYARLAHATGPEALGDLAEEITDRFGEPPPATRELLRRAALRLRCRSLRIERLEVGPKAAAATLRPGSELAEVPPGLRHSERRLILDREGDAEDQDLAERLLDLIQAASQPKKASNSAVVSAGSSSGR
jgi:transcription-repair coupling factor (superfamily II helicase)